MQPLNRRGITLSPAESPEGPRHATIKLAGSEIPDFCRVAKDGVLGLRVDAVRQVAVSIGYFLRGRLDEAETASDTARGLWTQARETGNLVRQLSREVGWITLAQPLVADPLYDAMRRGLQGLPEAKVYLPRYPEQ